MPRLLEPCSLWAGEEGLGIRGSSGMFEWGYDGMGATTGRESGVLL